MIGTPAHAPRGPALALPAIIAAMVLSIALASSSWPAGSVIPETPKAPLAAPDDNGRGLVANESRSSRAETRWWEVRSGDTLGKISVATGVKVRHLTALNPDLDANSLSVGDAVKIHLAASAR